MEAFVKSLRRKYSEQRISREKPWPPRHGNQHVHLELVSNEDKRISSAQPPQGEQKQNTRMRERSTIECAHLFKSKKQVVRKALIEGDAGIGKTTLSIGISVDWADEKLFNEFKLVLLLPLRDKRISKAGSLVELLRVLHSSQKICAEVADTLEETEGEDMLIVADGWDELSEANRQEDSFLHELLFGQLLPFVSVLVTSRSSAMAPLHKNPSIDRFVEIVGFSEENMKWYIESEFADDREKGARLLKQLEYNPLISSVCSIPLTCAIICHVWRYLDEDLPFTLTGLYTKVILHILYRNVQKSNAQQHLQTLSTFDSLPTALQSTWWHLCEFAFEAMKNDQVDFSEEELVQVHSIPVEESLQFGLLQSTESILPDDIGYGLSFQFLHLTFQEYLAALHLVRLPETTQLEIIKSFTKSFRFQMVWRFFFGIGCKKPQEGQRSVARALHSYNQISSTVISAFIEEAYVSSDTFFEDLKSESYYSQRIYPIDEIFFCHCAFEGDSEEINAQVAKALFDKAHFGIDTSRSSYDCAAALHVISHAPESSTMSALLNNCNISENQMKRLAKMLSKESKPLQVSRLLLGGNELTEKGVNTLFDAAASAFNSLYDLDLSNNQIRSEGVQSVMRALSKSPTNNLMYLRLSNNPLGVPGIQALAQAVNGRLLPMLDTLELVGSIGNDTEASTAPFIALAKALSSESPKLNHLDLSSNNISCDALQALGKAMSKLFHIERPSPKVCSHLTLNDMSFGDAGLRSFTTGLECTCFVDFVEMKKNDIHAAGLLILATAIITGTLRDVCNLRLDDNPLGVEAAATIGKMLSSDNCKLTHLTLTNCQLTSRAGEIAVPDSPKNSHPANEINTSSVSEVLCELPRNTILKVLRLNDNDFTGENSTILAGFMILCQNLNSLYTKRCCLNSEDLARILEKLFEYSLSTGQSKLNVWDLESNVIDDKGVDLLIKYLPIFSELDEAFRKVNVRLKPDLKRNTAVSKDGAVRLRKAVKPKYFEREELLGRLLVKKPTLEDWKILTKVFIKGTSQSNFEEFQLLWKCLATSLHYETVFAMAPTSGQRLIVSLKVSEAKTSTSSSVEQEQTTDSVTQYVSSQTLPILKKVFAPGLRVVRGRDWQSGEEDGGEGHAGTLVEVASDCANGGRMVVVQWDCGNRCSFRCGVEGKFDLRVLESAPIGPWHSMVPKKQCTTCTNGRPLVGMCWECAESTCENKICTRCYMDGQDSTEHSFVRRDYRISMLSYFNGHEDPSEHWSEQHSCLRVRVPPRSGARQIQAKGLYPGAVVVRGPDWNLEEVDGGDGKLGIVVSVVDLETPKYDEEWGWLKGDAVKVKWEETQETTRCRVGYMGKMDVKCVQSAPGGYYYPDHLPMLGAPYAIQQKQVDTVRDMQLMELKSAARDSVSMDTTTPTHEDQHSEKSVGELEASTSGDSPNERAKDSDEKDPDFNGSKTEAVIEIESGLTQDCLSIQDLALVRRTLWTTREKWYDLGVELDIEVSDLNVIKIANLQHPDHCFTPMLEKWLKRFYPAPTWSALIKALKSPPVDYPQIAEELSKKCARTVS